MRDLIMRDADSSRDGETAPRIGHSSVDEECSTAETLDQFEFADGHDARRAVQGLQFPPGGIDHHEVCFVFQRPGNAGRSVSTASGLTLDVDR